MQYKQISDIENFKKQEKLKKEATVPILGQATLYCAKCQLLFYPHHQWLQLQGQCLKFPWPSPVLWMMYQIVSRLEIQQTSKQQPMSGNAKQNSTLDNKKIGTQDTLDTLAGEGGPLKKYNVFKNRPKSQASADMIPLEAVEGNLEELRR